MTVGGGGGERPWVTATNDGPGFATEIVAGAHRFAVDEPLGVGGADTGPTPYDLLLASIAACTAITVRMYASRKAWPLEEVVVRLRTASKHAADCEDCADRPVALHGLEHDVTFVGPLTAEQRARLRYIASRCPLKQILKGSVDLRDVAAGGLGAGNPEAGNREAGEPSETAGEASA